MLHELVNEYRGFDLKFVIEKDLIQVSATKGKMIVIVEIVHRGYADAQFAVQRIKEKLDKIIESESLKEQKNNPTNKSLHKYNQKEIDRILLIKDLGILPLANQEHINEIQIFLTNQELY